MQSSILYLKCKFATNWMMVGFCWDNPPHRGFDGKKYVNLKIYHPFVAKSCNNQIFMQSINMNYFAAPNLVTKYKFE